MVIRKVFVFFRLIRPHLSRIMVGMNVYVCYNSICLIRPHLSRIMVGMNVYVCYNSICITIP